MISIIIPTLDEEKYIGKLLSFLEKHPQREQFEILLTDGGSTDGTLDIAKSHNDVKIINCSRPSRAYQMNKGTQQATGDILYFVHADVGLVPSFVDDIASSVKEGFKSGCFCCEFVDPNLAILKLNAWFTKFPFSWSRGGDQTLFITKAYFNELGGYDEKAVIMEDYFLIDQLLQSGTFKVLQTKVKISARKYKTNSYLRVLLANFKAMRMYKRGVNSKEIREYYESSLRS